MNNNIPGSRFVQLVQTITTEQGTSILEEHLALWPEDWGNKLHFLIYGDFIQPTSGINIESLGITISPENVEAEKVVKASCVLNAQITVSEKTIAGFIDASRRINEYLGISAIYCNTYRCRWFSALFPLHVFSGSGQLAGEKYNIVLSKLPQLPPETRIKVDAALYWIMEPHNLRWEYGRGDVLRQYSSFWNAFECLVKAVHSVDPPQKLTPNQKQAKIDELCRKRSGKLSAQDISDCYHQIVSPGMKGEASHALKSCFGDAADHYIERFFEKGGLAQTRNMINHGSVDALNPKQLLEVKSRLIVLSLTVEAIINYLISGPAIYMNTQN